jgi:hypothetical protein
MVRYSRRNASRTSAARRSTASTSVIVVPLSPARILHAWEANFYATFAEPQRRLGIGFGESGYALLKTIPDAVLGALLLFSGIELALSSKPQDYRDADLFLVLLMAAIGVALNGRGLCSRSADRLRPKTRVDQGLTAAAARLTAPTSRSR